MEKEFIPYEQVLDLEELKFNEKCFLTVNYTGNLYFCNGDHVMYETDKGKYKNIKYKYNIPEKYREIKIPTFSQAFRWFREKYNLYVEIKVEDNVRVNEQKYYWSIFGIYNSFEGNSWIRCIKDSNEILYNTYEEAELACLKKLIEIVKENFRKKIKNK